MFLKFFQKKKDTTPIPIRTEGKVTPKIPIVFLGTPALSRDILSALLTAQYRVVGVVTQPDRIVGRKKELTPSPVKELALQEKIPILQPERLDEAAIDEIAKWKPDLLVVAAYGKILPESLLKLPGLGALNVHFSLLPRWRGASPIQNALMAGDKKTGVTIMRMDKGMDTGDILAEKSVPILPDDTADVLSEKLTKLGSEFLVETLPPWIRREITAEPQAKDGITLCQLIEREDGRVFWSVSAEEIYNRYRGLHPWPGIFTFWKKGEDLLRLKLLRVSLQKTQPLASTPEGTVFETGEKIGVQTGLGVIFLEEVQLEGKEPVSVREFVNGNPDFIGTILT